MFEFNRDHFMMIGIVVLFAGVQFRYVDSYVLNEKTSEFIAARMSDQEGQAAQTIFTFVPEPATVVKRTVKPPPWLGWFCISIGAVSVLHALALKKPDG